MRQRLRPLRARAMARRPDGSGRFSLTPRARRIAGWIAAIAIIGVIAIGVRLVGSADGAGSPLSRSPGPTPAAATIRFGTALDPSTGEVAVGAETARFVRDDVFAYSYRPTTPPPPTVWVEVRRGEDGSGDAVQPPAPHGLAADARVIAFEVPAANLFADFGPGSYQMRIFVAEEGPVAASGGFELVDEGAGPSP